MLILSPSPLLTKLIYISKGKSKTQDKDKYADYIQRGNKTSLINTIVSMPVASYNDYEILNDVNLLLEKVIVIKNKETEQVILNSSTSFDSTFIGEIFTAISHNKKQLSKLNDYDELVARTIDQYCINNKTDPSLAMNFYNEYISRRLGSTGLFSGLGEDINQLLSEMKKHDGTIYLPIISMKEKDAELVGLKTETDWKIKAREYIKVFANSINLDESDVKWVCAYHEKNDDMINRESDAGKQPHLHFMIWLKPYIQRKKEKFSRTELTRLRQKGASVFLSDYLINLYEKENALQKELKESAKYDLTEEYQQEIGDLQRFIRNTTNGTGRLTYQTLLSTKDVLVNILYKSKMGESITQGELNTLQRHGIDNNEYQIRRRIEMYQRCIDGLNSLTDELLEDPEIKTRYHEWIQTKFEITKAWASTDESQIQTEASIAEFRKVIINSIIRNEDWIDKVVINDDLAGMLLEKISNSRFKRYIQEDELYMHIKTIADLLVSLGTNKDDIYNKIGFILARSGIRYETTKYVEIVNESFKNYTSAYFIASRAEVYKTLHALDDKVNPKFAYYPFKYLAKKNPSQLIRANMYQYITKDINAAKEDPEKEKERYAQLVKNYKSEINR